MTSSQEGEDREIAGSDRGPAAAPDDAGTPAPADDFGAVPSAAGSGAEPEPGAVAAPRLAPVLALYSAERIGLLVLLALLLSLFLTPLVAMMFAVVLQMPLAWLLFAKQRAKVNAAMASSRRRTDREQLRRALSGEDQSIG